MEFLVKKGFKWGDDIHRTNSNRHTYYATESRAIKTTLENYRKTKQLVRNPHRRIKRIMAKSKLQFKRSTTDKLNIKGTLSDDRASIVYVDENDTEQVVAISDLLNVFRNQPIEFTVQLKSEDELDIIPADDEE